ncbi:tetratricopeptide repeat protein [Meiothermus sp.]|jgi:tetratricopeptide (TPR) repeat protein|uniref:tetratricopeptide repeat protein n=1 Tax=Meiothermus sp. TaxID=1955249 RepID=UPI0021DD0511|nr:tetratricopeptide repeat protein [Meiothermus sp.]GIW24680.1 MAG: hypothetical protein KatS3mg069_0947 [Meiothermus sp.]
MTQQDGSTGIERALQHLTRGEALLALQVLDRVSWMDLAWPDYWRVRAEAFLLLGDYKQAASSAKEGLTDDPDNLPLLLLRIRALLELGELDKAQYALNHALQLAPQNLELQSLSNSLELRQDRKPKIPQTTPPTPTPTTPDTPAHPHDWRNTGPRRGKLFLSDADASAIKRAFENRRLRSPNIPVQRRSFAYLPVGFLLLSLALTAYWLWSQVGK